MSDDCQTLTEKIAALRQIQNLILLREFFWHDLIPVTLILIGWPVPPGFASWQAWAEQADEAAILSQADGIEAAAFGEGKPCPEENQGGG